MGRNHDLQCTENNNREQHQTTADSCGYEACHEHIPVTTQAVIGLETRGKYVIMLHNSTSTTRDYGRVRDLTDGNHDDNGNKNITKQIKGSVMPRYLQKSWLGLCGPLPKTLSKICVFCFLIYYLTKNSISYIPGGGGTPLYGLYRYVRPQRIWFFSRFGHK